MTKLRRDTQSEPYTAHHRHLRIVASGTLFLTHTLYVPQHPAPSTVVRAHSVEKIRGGSANTLLSLLAQFPAVDAVLVAPLGGNDEGRMILHDLENERIITRYCKIHKGAGVPSAWVLHSADGDTKTVINHNPLPDITHDDFIALLGPLLAPENFPNSTSPSVSSTIPSLSPSSGTSWPPSNQQRASPTLNQRSNSTPRASTSSSPHPNSGLSQGAILVNPNSPAPFDWLHFEGRSVKTTLSNMTGIDGLARERKWRSHCVFSVDVGRKGRQGVEALLPHADVIFLNKHYAKSLSPHYASTPRAFLLSLASLAPPHALLIAHWGSEGAALLSLPTKEYFQSSGWVEEKQAEPSPARSHRNINGRGRDHRDQEQRSVRSGSDFWADGRSQTPSSSAYTAGGSGYPENISGGTSFASAHSRSGGDERLNAHSRDTSRDTDAESQGTEVPGIDQEAEEGVVDEVGAQDAFVAGMIYALSRRIMPGAPFTPAAGRNGDEEGGEVEKGRWRLDECLRFATELAGRKARRRSWKGLADEMTRAGWIDTN